MITRAIGYGPIVALRRAVLLEIARQFSKRLPGDLILWNGNTRFFQRVGVIHHAEGIEPEADAVKLAVDTAEIDLTFAEGGKIKRLADELIQLHAGASTRIIGDGGGFKLEDIGDVSPRHRCRKLGPVIGTRDHFTADLGLRIGLLVKGDHIVGALAAIGRSPPHATKPGFSRSRAKTARRSTQARQRRRHQKSASINHLHLLLPRFANFSDIT